MKKLVILGATGSIGEQALEVVSRSDELAVVGLAAGRAGSGPSRRHATTASRRSPSPTPRRRQRHPRPGTAACSAARTGSGSWWRDRTPTWCLNGIVGSAGLGPTIVALTEGIELALANKESLVVGGELVTALAEATDTRIIPVDSEHSALFQLVGRSPRARSSAWS